jgi:hypothetical protein
MTHRFKATTDFADGHGLSTNADKQHLDLGVEVEEGVQAHFELGFDLLAASLEDVHGDVGLIAVFECDWSIAHLCYLIGGQQPHSIDQR